MMVMPKPPVDVMTAAGRGKAVLYADDVVVCICDGGRVYVFDEHAVKPYDSPVSVAGSPENPSQSGNYQSDNFRRGDVVRRKGGNAPLRVTDATGEALQYVNEANGHRGMAPIYQFEKVVPLKCPGHHIQYGRCAICGLTEAAIRAEVEKQRDANYASTSGVPVGYDPRPRVATVQEAPKNARPMPKWFVDIYTAAMAAGENRVLMQAGDHTEVLTVDELQKAFE
jgi:hypothetical protein